MSSALYDCHFKLSSQLWAGSRTTQDMVVTSHIKAVLIIGAVLTNPASAVAENALLESSIVDSAGLPKDLSPLGMFHSADVVVKSVLISLVLASVVTWTIAFAKSIEIMAARRSARKALRALASAATLRQGLEQISPVMGVVGAFTSAAADELRHSASAFNATGIKERMASCLHRLELAQVRRVNRGTGILATIGAIAPFVGLFGTVWGIMNSFIGISKSHTTNLAVVAPGIAEALLATAFGLVAAIPAVIIYNLLARSLASYRAELGDASAEVQRLVSRDLDRQSAGLATQRSPASLLAAE
jgi:biopolymer transport protein ExbB